MSYQIEEGEFNRYKYKRYNRERERDIFNKSINHLNPKYESN